MSSPQPAKKKEGKAKGTDPEDARRRREEHTVQLRKNRQTEQIAKHRKVRAGAAFLLRGAAPRSPSQPPSARTSPCPPPLPTRPPPPPSLLHSTRTPPSPPSPLAGRHCH